MYQNAHQSMFPSDCQDLISSVWKEQYPFISEASSGSLIYTLRNLDTAYKNFFRGQKKGIDVGYPQFKNKKSGNSFQFYQNYSINFKTGYINIPKLKTLIECRLHRKFENSNFDVIKQSKNKCWISYDNGETFKISDQYLIKTSTISKTSSGKYYISILVEDGLPEMPKIPYNDSTTIGIDMGLTHFAILSDGKKIDNNRYFVSSQKKLAKLQRRASRKQKFSNNWHKQNKIIASCHEKIANQRSDFQHNISKELVTNYDCIAIETLNIKGMMQNPKLSKAIADVSWSEFFRQLRYKAEYEGKTVIEVDQWKATSHICNVCGTKTAKMGLNIREWTCTSCNTTHDRDINAAINIKNSAPISC
jgi:putative transposase